MYCRETVKVGDWDLFKGLDWSPLSTESEETDGESQSFALDPEYFFAEGVPILRVVTREEPPYVMKCLNCSALSGNQSVAYQGFAIDLLDAISKVSHSQWRLDVSTMTMTLWYSGCRLPLLSLPSSWQSVRGVRPWDQGVERNSEAGIFYTLSESMGDRDIGQKFIWQKKYQIV